MSFCGGHRRVLMTYESVNGKWQRSLVRASWCLVVRFRLECFHILLCLSPVLHPRGPSHYKSYIILTIFMLFRCSSVGMIRCHQQALTIAAVYSSPDDSLFARKSFLDAFMSRFYVRWIYRRIMSQTLGSVHTINNILASVVRTPLFVFGVIVFVGFYVVTPSIYKWKWAQIPHPMLSIHTYTLFIDGEGVISPKGKHNMSTKWTTRHRREQTFGTHRDSFRQFWTIACVLNFQVSNLPLLHSLVHSNGSNISFYL